VRGLESQPFLCIHGMERRWPADLYLHCHTPSAH
jgi:hypothetical protein